MRTVAKFRASDGPNPIISTTLGKLAVIDKNWTPPDDATPTAKEFWLIDIIRETQPGKAAGCFIVRPIRCVARPLPETPEQLDRNLLYLLPGMFTIEVSIPGPLLRPIAIVNPNELDGRDWVLPLDAAKIISSIRSAYAVVVNLGGDPWNHVRRPRVDDAQA